MRVNPQVLIGLAAANLVFNLLFSRCLFYIVYNFFLSNYIMSASSCFASISPPPHQRGL